MVLCCCRYTTYLMVVGHNSHQRNISTQNIYSCRILSWNMVVCPNSFQCKIWWYRIESIEKQNHCSIPWRLFLSLKYLHFLMLNKLKSPKTLPNRLIHFIQHSLMRYHSSSPTHLYCTILFFRLVGSVILKVGYIYYMVIYLILLYLV